MAPDDGKTLTAPDRMGRLDASNAEIPLIPTSQKWLPAMFMQHIIGAHLLVQLKLSCMGQICGHDLIKRYSGFLAGS